MYNVPVKLSRRDIFLQPLRYLHSVLDILRKVN